MAGLLRTDKSSAIDMTWVRINWLHVFCVVLLMGTLGPKMAEADSCKDRNNCCDYSGGLCQTADYGGAEHIAFVVGVNSYQQWGGLNQPSDLENAINDALDIGDVIGDADRSVRYILNPNEAQFHEELRALHTALKADQQTWLDRNRNRKLIFFFAGHGAHFDGFDTLVLPPSSDETREQKDNLITESYLKTVFASIRKLEVLIILDACRAPLDFGVQSFLHFEGATGNLSVAKSTHKGAPAQDKVPLGEQNNGLYSYFLKQMFAVPGISMGVQLDIVENLVHQQDQGQLPVVVNSGGNAVRSVLKADGVSDCERLEMAFFREYWMNQCKHPIDGEESCLNRLNSILSEGASQFAACPSFRARLGFLDPDNMLELEGVQMEEAVTESFVLALSGRAEDVTYPATAVLLDRDGEENVVIFRNVIEEDVNNSILMALETQSGLSSGYGLNSAPRPSLPNVTAQGGLGAPVTLAPGFEAFAEAEGQAVVEIEPNAAGSFQLDCESVRCKDGRIGIKALAPRPPQLEQSQPKQPPVVVDQFFVNSQDIQLNGTNDLFTFDSGSTQLSDEHQAILERVGRDAGPDATFAIWLPAQDETNVQTNTFINSVRATGIRAALVNILFERGFVSEARDAANKISINRFAKDDLTEDQIVLRTIF